MYRAFPPFHAPRSNFRGEGVHRCTSSKAVQTEYTRRRGTSAGRQALYRHHVLKDVNNLYINKINIILHRKGFSVVRKGHSWCQQRIWTAKYCSTRVRNLAEINRSACWILSPFRCFIWSAWRGLMHGKCAGTLGKTFPFTFNLCTRFWRRKPRRSTVTKGYFMHLNYQPPRTWYQSMVPIG